MKRYLKDPQASQDDLRRSGVYTLYNDNVLQSSTLVMTNTTGGAVQYEVDEKSARWRRRVWDPSAQQWKDWSEYIPVTYT